MRDLGLEETAERFGLFRDGNGGGCEVSCGNGVQEGAHVCSAWLMLNREGLDILVHPLTDDSVADHTQFALWLGAPQPLRVEVLRRGPRTG